MSKLSYKTLLIIFFSLLIGIVILWKFVLPNHKVEASWWNDGWNYRKAISISNTSGSNLTDFQISLSIGTSALIASGKMQNDCDDIRITDINGNLLPYWIEENNPGCNQITDTKIWIKANSIPTSGATIYIYYGNTSASSAQNGTNTFEFFDDFNGSSLRSDWNQDSGSWQIGTTAGQSCAVIYNPASNNHLRNTNYSTNNSYVIELQNLSQNVGGQAHPGVIFNATQGYNDQFYWRAHQQSGGIQGAYYNGSLNMTTSFNSIYTWSTWMNTKIGVSGDSAVIYQNNTQKGSLTGLHYDGIYSNVGLLAHNRSNNYFNYIFVHKYTSVEPTATLQSEEAGGGPVAYWKFDEGSGTTAYDSTSNQNNGVISGATWSDESQCISGKCLNFKNASDVINAGNVTNSQNITASAWIYPTLNGNSSGGDIFMKLYSGSDPWVSFGTELYTNNKIRFAIDDNGYKSCLSTTQLELNKWYFITTRIDNSTMKGYINGKEECTYTRTTIMRFNTNPFRITGANSPDNFIGKIDDLKVYSYARTADQIKQDYNSRGSSSGSGVNMGSSNGGINLSDGLVGYWKMDEGTGTTTADYSGNSNTGTLSNVGWSSGKFGIGASFNGTTSYISTTKNFSSTTPYTIVLWAKPGTSLDTNRHNIIVGPGPVWNPGIWVANNKIRVHGATEYRDYTISWTDLSWHMLGQVFDGTTAYIIWDGQIVSGTRTAYSPSTPTQLFLGAENTTGNSYNWNGSMDEVRYYNRALSPAEVSQLYEFAPGPVGYWDFEENTGTVAKDKSGNNNNGTLVNSPIWTPGKIGSGLNFDASSNKYVSLANTTNLGNISWTVSGWVKMPTGISRIGIFLGNYSDSPNINLEVVTTMRIYWNSGEINAYGNTDLRDNNWHYITYIRDKISGNFYMYIDGKLDQTISGSGTDLTISTPFWIGSDKRSGGMTWHGNIDDVKIYNYARTQKQIIEDMNGSRPAASAKSPIGYWKFDEGSGTTINNSGNGGSALNGTFGTGSSAPTWINESKSGKGLSFDGTNDYISIPDTNNILDMSNVTITGWLYKTTNASDHHTILSRNGESFFINFYNNTFESYFFTSGGTCYNSGTSYLPYLNGWHYFATSYDGQNSKLYLDSKLIKTVSTCSGSINSSNQNLFIGSRTATSAFLNSKIDELKIYNYALTDEEIKQDYNQNSAMQMGQTSQTIGGTTTSLEYCIPGDTSYCTSPVAEWNFEENTGTTAKDSSGNNNTGTISGATWTTGANNKGAALNFNGSSDYVSIPDSSASLSSNFTVSFWVKPNDDSNNPRWFSLIDGSNNLQIGHMGTDEKVYFRFADSAIETITGITLNQWTFVTCKMESGTRKIFFNGIEQTTESGGITSNATYSAIGGGFPNYTTNGKIDNVKIYNYARTPAQIAYDYNKGAPVGWWKFDECQGGTAYDSSGVGNTGVIVIGSSGTQNSLGTCQIGTSAAWTNGASGKINSSLNFDGNDDYVSINDNDVLDPSQITISAWVKPSSLSNSGNFIGKGDNSGYRMRIYSDGSIGFLDRGRTNGLVTATGVCSVGNWYHIVGVGSSNGLKIYLNGKLLTQNSTAYGGPNTSSPLKIGLAMTSEYFQGQIDDVRIYNYALTPEQVKTLYNGGAVSFN